MPNRAHDEAPHLQRMIDAVDAFVARQDGLGELLEALLASCTELHTVAPDWRARVLNLWTSLELIHKETRACRRDLTEMELRFVLSLSLEVKRLVTAARETLTEPLADAITQ